MLWYDTLTAGTAGVSCIDVGMILYVLQGELPSDCEMFLTIYEGSGHQSATCLQGDIVSVTAGAACDSVSGPRHSRFNIRGVLAALAAYKPCPLPWGLTPVDRTIWLKLPGCSMMRGTTASALSACSRSACLAGPGTVVNAMRNSSVGPRLSFCTHSASAASSASAVKAAAEVLACGTGPGASADVAASSSVQALRVHALP